jgi:hypothetical protein
VVFDATRIEAAYGNSGEYSAASADLRFARGAGQMLLAPAQAAPQPVDGPGVQGAVRQHRKRAHSEMPMRRLTRGLATVRWLMRWENHWCFTMAPTRTSPFSDHGAGERFGHGVVHGYYLTQDPAEASAYAGRGVGANVLPVHVRLTNPSSLTSIKYPCISKTGRCVNNGACLPSTKRPIRRPKK